MTRRGSRGDDQFEWDVFISYASEDRTDLAEPLAAALRNFGVKVWLDRTELRVGSSLRRSIDDGLARSRYGIVVLSQHFFEKEYPNRELDGLAQKELDGESVILPVWHGVTPEAVRRYSPPLADKVALSSSDGVPRIALKLLEVLRPQAIQQLQHAMQEVAKGIRPVPEIFTKNDLVQVLDRSEVFNLANEDLPTPKDVDLVARFFEACQDWGDLSGMLEPSESLRASEYLGEVLAEVKAAGWRVFGSRTRAPIKFGKESHEMEVAQILVAGSDASDVFEIGDGRLGVFRSKVDAKPGEP